jgi:hypothetical protein
MDRGLLDGFSNERLADIGVAILRRLGITEREIRDFIKNSRCRYRPGQDQGDPPPPQDGGSSGPVIGPTRKIKGLSINWKDGFVKTGNGTDNWPMIKADDGFMYGIGGDGHGIAGKQEYKRSMIISLFSGSLRPPQAVNTAKDVWYCDGKSYGGYSTGNYLYIYRGPGSGWDAMSKTSVEKFSLHPFQRLQGARLWNWDRGIFHPVVAQNVPGDYVYLFSAHGRKQKFEIVDDPAQQWLIRCHKDWLLHRDHYEYFCGRPGVEAWTSDIKQMQPVAHVHKTFLPAVQFLPWINRYIMLDWIEIHTPTGGSKTPRCSLAVYESPAIYGPWNKVQTLPFFGAGHISYPSIFYANLAPSWWDFPEGWLVFSGFVESDRFHAVKIKVRT